MIRGQERGGWERRGEKREERREEGEKGAEENFN